MEGYVSVKGLRAQQIQHAIIEGERDIDVLCELAGIKHKNFWNLCADRDVIVADDMQPYNFYHIVRQGFSLRKLAETTHLSHQGVANLLHKTGTYGEWREGRKRKILEEEAAKMNNSDVVDEKETEARKGLISKLKSKVYEKAMQSDVPEERAYAYFMAKRAISLTVDQVGGLLRLYAEKKAAGEKAALHELGAPFDIAVSTAGRLLEFYGHEPLYWKVHNGKRFTREEREKVKAASAYPVSAADVAYFLGRNDKVVARMPEWNNRLIRAKRLAIGKENKQLTYRLSSQIYEAQDADFTRQEIAEYLNTGLDFVNHAISYREEIGAVLIDVLDEMFPEQKITKPYRTK